MQYAARTDRLIGQFLDGIVCAVPVVVGALLGRMDAETGQPCSFGQSFVRNLLLSLLGPIDWIFIFGEKHQRLGDMAAGTIVVSAAR